MKTERSSSDEGGVKVKGSVEVRRILWHTGHSFDTVRKKGII